jgi:hypothetical protein
MDALFSILHLIATANFLFTITLSALFIVLAGESFLRPCWEIILVLLLFKEMVFTQADRQFMRLDDAEIIL